MEQKFISIIIPLYNCELYIKKCLDSIRIQTYKNFEIIIVNDGSSDNSEKIVQEYIKEFGLKNIKIYTQQNKGVSAARNIGLKKAKGDFITFIDSDDYIEKNYLYELQSKIDKNDWVIANFWYYYDDKNIQNKYFSDDNNKDICTYNIFNSKKAQEVIGKRIDSMRNVWGKLYKKDIIERNDIKFDINIKHFEDGLFNLEYLLKVNKIEFINECLYYYYMDSKDSATKRFRESILDEDEKKIKRIDLVLENILCKNEIKIAYKIFKFDLFVSYLSNNLFHRKNRKKYIEKKKQLISILTKDIYNCFDKDIVKYLNKKKKVLYYVLKYKKFYILYIIFKIIYKRRNIKCL